MAYVALYRKWRPGNFTGLVGQDHVSKTLSNAIMQGKLSHAYLFTGPRGTGKTSTAKILAKALNCDKGPTPDPCNECENCRHINDGTSMDVYEIDAASNRGIDEIRELRETVKFAPVSGRFKVYIIDEVHMLTSEAFNALLKTLEEPPANVVFVLATTEIHKVPATIQSRCQRYDFKRIAIEDIIARLSEVCEKSGIKADNEAIRLVAYQADGGMRDALSILDQCAALTDSEITAAAVRDVLGLIGHEQTVRIIKAIAAKNANEILTAISDILVQGKDLRQLASELISELRALMIYKAAGKLEGTTFYETDEAVLGELAGLFAAGDFMPIIQKLNDALNDMKQTTDPRITLETALLSLCAAPVVQSRPVAAEQGQTSNVAAAKIQQLEARLAQLTATVTALESRNTVSAGTVPKKETGQREVKAAAARRSVKKVVPLAVTQEGKTIFANLLSRVKDDKKASVAACLGGTSFAGMDEVHFRIQAPNSFTMNRLSQKDYKSYLEQCLQELSGREMMLECIFEPQAPAKPDKVLPPEDPADIGGPDLTQLTPEAKDCLAESMKILGDHFVDKDIYEKEHKL